LLTLFGIKINQKNHKKNLFGLQSGCNFRQPGLGCLRVVYFGLSTHGLSTQKKQPVNNETRLQPGTKKSCTVGRYDSCTFRKYWSYFRKLYIIGLVVGLYSHFKKSFEKCFYRSCKNQKNDLWDSQDPGREIW
jgi:hypothetical protein